MKKISLLGFTVLAFSVTAHAFQGATITDAKLLNPQISAGEQMRIQFHATANPGQQIMTNSGSSVYLGFIQQNIFPQSDGLNLNSESLGGDLYEITSLVVNPWAAPDRPYEIEQFCVSVMPANGHSTCLEAYEGAYWEHDPTDGTIKAYKTQIPIMKFTVAPNPNADNIGPSIESIAFDKAFYYPGDEVHMQLSATDNLSGVPDQASGYFSTDALLFENGGFAQFSSKGSNVFVSNEDSPVVIKTDAQPGKYPVSNIGIMDRAKNYGFLMRTNPKDTTYTRYPGAVVTQIPIFEIEVRAKQ
jgi:hypothetical protein